MANIANKNCTLECSHTCLAMVISENPSNNTTLSNSETLLDGTKIKLSGIKGNLDQNSVCTSLTVTIQASSNKVSCKSNGVVKKVLLEGDSGSAIGTFINSSSGVESTETVKVIIKKAGQLEVSGK